MYQQNSECLGGSCQIGRSTICPLPRLQLLGHQQKADGITVGIMAAEALTICFQEIMCLHSLMSFLWGCNYIREASSSWQNQLLRPTSGIPNIYQVALGRQLTQVPWVILLVCHTRRLIAMRQAKGLLDCSRGLVGACGPGAHMEPHGAQNGRTSLARIPLDRKDGSTFVAITDAQRPLEPARGRCLVQFH